MDEGYTIECKKDALRQMQDGGIKVTFNINPVDMPNELYSDPMGQRYMMVIVPIGDDEQPIQKAKSHAGAAKLLAKDEMFEKYLNQMQEVGLPDDNEVAMKYLINIKSCSELIEGSIEYGRFKVFRSDFNYWKRAEEQSSYYER